MQQNHQSTIWLTQTIIEQQLLTNSIWHQGWEALEQHVTSCHQPECPYCILYHQILEVEQSLVKLMKMQGLDAHHRFQNLSCTAEDFYQFWIIEYHSPLSKNGNNSRKPGKVSIIQQAKNLSHLEKLLKKFARERAINYAKEKAKYLEQSMTDTLNNTIGQSTPPEIEEQLQQKTIAQITDEFIQKSMQIDAKATFAHVVLKSPELLLKYPALLQKGGNIQVTSQIIQQLEHLIQQLEEKAINKGTFRQLVSQLFQLSAYDIDNWSKKKPFNQGFLQSWKKKLTSLFR